MVNREEVKTKHMRIKSKKEYNNRYKTPKCVGEYSRKEKMLLEGIKKRLID